MGDDQWIATEFELNELPYVPAGDGAPAQWKRKGMRVGEFKRHCLEGRQNRMRRPTVGSTFWV